MSNHKVQIRKKGAYQELHHLRPVLVPPWHDDLIDVQDGDVAELCPGPVEAVVVRHVVLLGHQLDVATEHAVVHGVPWREGT